MKPLELHIYDKHPDADAYRVGGFYSPYCLVSRDKRFSEAELAAEYHAHYKSDLLYPDSFKVLIQSNDEWTATIERWYESEVTLERFATLPHASDNDYE